MQLGHTTGPVQILQIGDSHTANDGFSGRMRELFQARFGDAGRGMLPPGIPFTYYRPAQVAVTASGWLTTGSLNPAHRGPFGVAGVRQHADGPAEMTLTGAAPGGLGRVWTEVVGQPGGGTVDASAGAGPAMSFSTHAPTVTPMFLTMPPVPKGGTLTLRARGDGPVDVLSWAALRDRPGVAYSNLGTIGAKIGEIFRFDPLLMRAELARLHPALILIAFGTNEGFDDDTDMAGYLALYARAVHAVHEAAPWAALVIIGPPDGNRAASSRGAISQVCPHLAGEHTSWAIPARLPEVRAAERSFAREERLFYWDWSAAMGGPCTMQLWARTTPPMGAPDHVHLLKPGYRATAEKLFDAIMGGYVPPQERHASR